MELNKENMVPKNESYIKIVNTDENVCSSPIGEIFHGQPIEISGCNKWWMVLHEFVHALGTYTLY